MNVTLKDIPDALHHRLCEVAKDSGRSLNRLILHTLEQVFCAQKSDRAALLKRIRLRRKNMNVWVDEKSLANAIEDGRA